MTETAQQEGRSALVLSVQEWNNLVVHPMRQPDPLAFIPVITRRVGPAARTDELNRWLGLAINIRTMTTKPGRRGRTANE